MDFNDISQSKKILCYELNTGKNYNGFFYFDDETIQAELISFDNVLSINADETIFLRTETNHIISLHNNFSSIGHTSSGLTKKMRTFREKIISNNAIIGHDKWKENDPIKRVIFSIKHVDQLLKNIKQFDRFIKAKPYGEGKTEIFSIKVKGCMITAGYRAQYILGYDEPREVWPYITIEFDQAVPLSDYLDSVLSFVRFLSLSIGRAFTPSSIKICRLSVNEMINAVEDNSYHGEYSVKYVWPGIDFQDSDIRIGGALFRLHDDHDSKIFKEGLKSFFDSEKDWRKAHIQMMVCLELDQEISARRLLEACKWFEEIPSTKAENAIKDTDLKIISENTANEAKKLGYDNLEQRVFGVLKSIKKETNEMRFKRLVSKLKNKFVLDFLDQDLIDHLKKAFQYRGRTAHGHFSPKDDEEFSSFLKSIYAIEMFCFLLVADSLPLDERGIERVANHRFVQNYKYS